MGRRSRRAIPAATFPDKSCAECGDTFTPGRRNQRYCSSECYRRGNARRPKFTPEERSCLECGKTYVAHRYDARFCSQLCRKRAHGRERQNRRRTQQWPQPYADRDVFERDGWICQLCGDPVDPELSRRVLMGATVDHRVPLSAGGLDVWDNVCLAHRKCNTAKGVKLLSP